MALARSAAHPFARTYATLLGYEEAARLLQQTLDEEKEADKTLSGLAAELNVQALEAAENVAERGEEAPLGTGSGTRVRKSRVRGKQAA